MFFYKISLLVPVIFLIGCSAWSPNPAINAEPQYTVSSTDDFKKVATCITDASYGIFNSRQINSHVREDGIRIIIEDYPFGWSVIDVIENNTGSIIEYRQGGNRKHGEATERLNKTRHCL